MRRSRESGSLEGPLRAPLASRVMGAVTLAFACGASGAAAQVDTLAGDSLADLVNDSARRVVPALVFDSATRADPLARAQGQDPTSPSPSIPPDEAVDRDGDGIPTLVDFCPDSPPGSRVDQTGCPPEPTPWWIWAGGGLGLLAVFRIGWVPYSRWKFRKRLREARIEGAGLPGGGAGPFQAPGAPVPWQAAPGQAPSEPAQPPGPAPWMPKPEGSPAVETWQPPDLDADKSGEEPPLAPTEGAVFDMVPPPSPTWRVGFPDPSGPGVRSTDSPQDAGFPSSEADSAEPTRAVPAPVVGDVGDDRLFASNPSNPGGYHDWQDQPLHYEEKPRARGVAWVVRHPLLTLAMFLTAGLGGAAWLLQGQNTPVPTAPRGVTQVSVPTVVALTPDTVSAAPTGDTRVPAALRMVDGDAQTGRVGRILPIPVAVQVEDDEGVPIPGVPVIFEATVGGGVVSPIATQTDSSGVARSFWTLGSQVVKQYAVARVAGSEAGVAFEADALPGEASRIVVIRGDSQSAPPGQLLTEPVVVRVESDDGQPLEGIRITFATGGLGTANPTEGVSDTLGVVSTAWTLGSTGDTATLRAEIADAPGIGTQVLARLDYPTLPARSGVFAGGTHSCVLSPNGNLACWGGNQSGQLGTGGGRAASPTRVAIGQQFSEVSAGLSHTCGLASNGVAYCWGDNANGQLGDGSRAGQPTPNAVAAEIRFRRVSAGTSHTCGISRDAAVYCWGSNVSGQLGDGTRSDRDRPTRVAGGGTFQSVAVGWFHTCALTSGGSASCWGRNAFGQLGDGTTEDHATPARVGGSTGYQSIAAGGAHTCGLGTDRAVYCWGQNNYGQLGAGGNQPRSRPTPVAGGPWRSVTVGGVHTCALASDGSAFCWGRNTYGQLGDGTTVDRDLPVAVGGGLVFASIRASGAHTCGTTASSEQYCWGYNVEGQLGDGSRQDRLTPTRVSGSE